MTIKKLDKRIVENIQHSIRFRHRLVFFVSGDKSMDQVGYIHHALQSCRQEADMHEPSSILWCFKKVPVKENHRRRSLKRLRNCYTTDSAVCDDTMENFIISSDPYLCHYGDTEKILGQTFSMLVVQDFEALTPNTLARIIECVEGGGIIIFLLPVPVIELLSMPMDIHAKYATESHPFVQPVFNKRFVGSLQNNSGCMVLDDQLLVEWSSEPKVIFPGIGLSSLPVIPNTLTETEKSVYLLCRTASQVKALKKLKKALYSSNARVVSLSSGRGRGKSAILGLAAALGLSGGGLVHVVVTSPNPENLKSFFDFIIRGLEAVGFREGTEYNILKDASDVITSILISHMGKKGRVVYYTPLEHHVAAAADLVIIDEAAAIPLAIVKGWIRQGLTIFMASTIQGYEGTGRSLSLKLLKELSNPFKDTDHKLVEVTLTEPIRYSNGDPVEKWLHSLLCLEAAEDQLFAEIPPAPEDCQLYYVSREILFSGSQNSETFLQNLVSLFVVSHYKNSPNDLLMMADAPAHRIFCLVSGQKPQMPLCAIQVALEGGISPESSQSQQSQGRRSSGDLVPWIISQQFQDHEFPSLFGARIVRIATHPAYQGMGYGRQALEQLSVFYSSPRTDPEPEKCGKSALKKLNCVKDQRPLKYLGVSYGLTAQLFNFWKKAGFVPVYIRQTTSNVTGEHSCVMLRNLQGCSAWLDDFYLDFVSRFFPLLPTAFQKLPSPLVIEVLRCASVQPAALPEAVVQFACTPRSILRLSAYCQKEVDYHLIADLIPNLAPLMLMGRLDDGYSHHYSRECVLVGVGLQYKTADVVARELKLDPSVIMGTFRRAVKKILVAIQKRPPA